MTDAELAKLLGIENEPKRDAFIKALAPEKRAVFERMNEMILWTSGLGPKPPGVLICERRKR